MRYFVVCSDTECRFSKGFASGEKRPEFCPMCGKPFLHKCPNCQQTIITKGASCCEQCGKPFHAQADRSKDIPQNGQNSPI